MSTRNDLRQLNGNEIQILDALLGSDFPGRSDLIKQISQCRVSCIDKNGSLRFFVGDSAPATRVRMRIPVEAEYSDDDGVAVHVLLHVVDGRVDELEVYKDDLSPIMRKPDAASLRVWVKDF